MSPEYGLIGTTLYGKNRWSRTPFKLNTFQSDFSLKGIDKLPRVDVIYVTADMSTDLIDAAVNNGAKGIVPAGVGNGNMTGAALKAVEAASKKGVVVVRATRVPSGTVGRNVEVNDDEVGTVVAGELSPAKARVLLKLALLKTSNPAKIQQLFDVY